MSVYGASLLVWVDLLQGAFSQTETHIHGEKVSVQFNTASLLERFFLKKQLVKKHLPVTTGFHVASQGKGIVEKRPQGIIVAMAATATFQGGASISFPSIVFFMGITRVPLCSVVLCSNNDCPTTCRMPRTQRNEEMMMCCVYEYVHVHVRKNKYIRTHICVYK